LEAFAELLPGLERMAKGRQAAAEIDAAAIETLTSQTGATRITPRAAIAGPAVRESNEVFEISSAFREAFAAAESTDAELEALRRYFVLHKVESEDDIHQNANYYLRSKDKAHLIRTSRTQPITDVVPIRNALTEQPLKPVSKLAVLQLAAKGGVLRLTMKQRPTAPDDMPAARNQPTSLDAQEGEEDEVPDERAGLGLNMGDFSQLMEAAQRSGLVPNGDAIAHLRDREFRIGDYQKALQDLEAIYAKFTASAGQRQQRLRREELDIKSGKLQMSARDLLQKRERDEAENQHIGRARRRFQRVIEGLRMLAGGE
jgi:hypothetical protein